MILIYVHSRTHTHMHTHTLTLTHSHHSHTHNKAFSSRVFYNADTGLFEQVHTEGMLGWGVTPSSSLATLYLADEAIGRVRKDAVSK